MRTVMAAKRCSSCSLWKQTFADQQSCGGTEPSLPQKASFCPTHVTAAGRCSTPYFILSCCLRLYVVLWMSSDEHEWSHYPFCLFLYLLFPLCVREELKCVFSPRLSWHKASKYVPFTADKLEKLCHALPSPTPLPQTGFVQSNDPIHLSKNKIRVDVCRC